MIDQNMQMFLLNLEKNAFRSQKLIGQLPLSSTNSVIRGYLLNHGHSPDDVVSFYENLKVDRKGIYIESLDFSKY